MKCSKSTFLFLDFWDFSILNNFKALTRIYHNFSRLSPILTGQKRIERGDSQLSIRFFLVKIRHHLEQIWWIRVGALKLFKIEKITKIQKWKSSFWACKKSNFEHLNPKFLNCSKSNIHFEHFFPLKSVFYFSCVVARPGNGAKLSKSGAGLRGQRGQSK